MCYYQVYRLYDSYDECCRTIELIWVVVVFRGMKANHQFWEMIHLKNGLIDLIFGWIESGLILIIDIFNISYIFVVWSYNWKLVWQIYFEFDLLFGLNFNYLFFLYIFFFTFHQPSLSFFFHLFFHKLFIII